MVMEGIVACTLVEHKWLYSISLILLAMRLSNTAHACFVRVDGKLACFSIKTRPLAAVITCIIVCCTVIKMISICR